MKRPTKRHKKLKIASGIILATGVLAFAGFKTGFIEDVTSQMTVPFSLFVGNQELKNPSKNAISVTGQPDIASFNDRLKPFFEKFNDQAVDQPDIDDIKATKTASDKLFDLMNSIYGRPHTFVASAQIIGARFDKFGWSPVINIAYLDDSTQVTNQQFIFYLNNDQITNIKKIKTFKKEAWPLSMAPDTDFSSISSGLQKADKILKSDNVQTKGISVSKKAKELSNYLNNSALISVMQISDPDQVLLEYKVGTNKEFKTITFVLDSNENTITEIK